MVCTFLALFTSSAAPLGVRSGASAALLLGVVLGSSIVTGASEVLRESCRRFVGEGGASSGPGWPASLARLLLQTSERSSALREMERAYIDTR
jgi:hypothetical protein